MLFLRSSPDATNDGQDDALHLRTKRMLHSQRTHFNVQLFLDLQFVDESLALDFESLDETNPSIVHFCKAVQAQVFGSIVEEAASAYNSTILNEDAEDDDHDNDGGLVGCNIVATSRVYDPEAEDVFGVGYFSLQVQVSQRVVVESTNQTLYLEVVQSVVEKGFDVVSGGQLEFRNNLYENYLFRSIISVRIRRGLTAPMAPPTPNPITRPISNPPTKLTNRPTNLPTKRPTNLPTKRPTPRPTNIPTVKPTRRPTPRPTRNPTPHPTVYPTRFPTLDPSGFPSILPSSTPSRVPTISPTPNPTPSPSYIPTMIWNSNIDWNPSQDESSVLANRNSVVVAAILGGSLLLATISCLLCLFFYKYHTNSRRYSTFRSPIPLSQNHSHAFIPGFVEVGDDHQSLADTTLESPIAGAGKRRQRPSFRKGLGSSFDESSLYTTPFSYDNEPEQRATAIPPPLPLKSVRSSFSSTLMTPLDYEEKVIFPPSESVSDDEHDANGEGVELQLRETRSKPRQSFYQLQNGRLSGPVDLDASDLESSEPYDEKYHNNSTTKITKIEPLEASPPRFAVKEHDDFSRIPSDLDVWSCDFQEFDRGSDFYKGEENSISLSSSASTKRIHNTILPEHAASSSILTMESKKKGIVLKPIPPPTTAKSRKSLSKIGAIRKGSIQPPGDKENKHTVKIQPPGTLSRKARDGNTHKEVSIPPPKTQPQRFREKENNPNASQKPSMPSKLNPNIKNSSTPLFLLRNQRDRNGKSDLETNPRTVSPEESSLTSKKSIRSKNSIVSDTSKATKPGTSTAAMDCLANGSGLLVSSLKDGVTTINETGNGVVKSAAPQIDKLSNGIVKSIRAGAPHIESLGNGLVSSLTDIFDRMTIPKITPEESLASESTLTIDRRAPIDILFSNTVSDDDSGISASPWLMDKVEKTLGPKSEHADLASLNSHKSPLRKSQYGSEVSYGSRSTLGISSMNHNGSEASFRSKRSYNYHQNRKRGNGTDVSFGSRSSRYSQYSKPDIASIMSRASASMSADILAQETPGEISFAKPSRTALEEKKKRLEQQLAELNENGESSANNANKDATSSVTMSSVTWGSLPTIALRNRTFRDRRQVIVCVPPGKLGVILADLHDGNGTVINSIKAGSPVERILKPGDKLIAVDEIAVVGMTCSQITSLIASRADQERRFTIMTTVIKKKKSIIEEAAAVAAKNT